MENKPTLRYCTSLEYITVSIMLDNKPYEIGMFREVGKIKKKKRRFEYINDECICIINLFKRGYRLFYKELTNGTYIFRNRTYNSLKRGKTDDSL